MMLACVDVDYREQGAVAACVLFRNWTDETSARELVEQIAQVQPYEPGQFYKRELPCLLSVLSAIGEPVDLVVVDGYVWLQDENSPGLGARLYEALQKRIPVIGVAKTRFASARTAVEVCRGESARPLHVTAAGIDTHLAAQHIASMHGEFRLPTLLKRVDQLCRNS